MALKENYKDGEVLKGEDMNAITILINSNSEHIENLDETLNNVELKLSWKDFN